MGSVPEEGGYAMIDLTAFALSASSTTGSTIFASIWGLLMGFFTVIVNGMGNVFVLMMNGFGQSVVIMFQGFGFSLAGYGVWAPVMFVVGLASSLMVGYLFFVFIDFEKDIVGVEEAA